MSSRRVSKAHGQGFLILSVDANKEFQKREADRKIYVSFRQWFFEAVSYLRLQWVDRNYKGRNDCMLNLSQCILRGLFDAYSWWGLRI
jgi:hypothetical protein